MIFIILFHPDLRLDSRSSITYFHNFLQLISSVSFHLPSSRYLQATLPEMEQVVANPLVLNFWGFRSELRVDLGEGKQPEEISWTNRGFMSSCISFVVSHLAAGSSCGGDPVSWVSLTGSRPARILAQRTVQKEVTKSGQGQSQV